MSNKKHLNQINQSVEKWNSCMIKNAHSLGSSSNDLPDVGWVTILDGIPQRANLVAADLKGKNLRNINLGGTDLFGANLSKSNLTNAIFEDADSSAAKFNGANLCNAFFYRANLEKALFKKANLNGAIFCGANLKGANFEDAEIHGANFKKANLSGTKFRKATLKDVNFEKAILIETDLQKAVMSNCLIYGISAWKLKLEGTTMSSLVITSENEPTITVDDIEVAQFIYLLLDNKKIRNVINTITSKMVLILGSFTKKRKMILEAIKENLKKHNYVPVIFDFDKPANRDTQETVTTLARLSRFVIADITTPKSIPQELIGIVESLPSLPIQLLQKYGSKPWGMFDHIKQYPWVLNPHRYNSLNDLLGSLKKKVIDPAEQKAKELEIKQ